MKTIKKYKTEILDLKNRIISIKNWMEGFNSRVHIDEEKIIEQEGSLEETIQKKCQSHKRMKKLSG